MASRQPPTRHLRGLRNPRALALGAAVLLFALAVADWWSAGLSHDLYYGTAILVVETEPPGAAVLVDGRGVGRTPIEVKVRPGTRVVKLEHRYRRDVLDRLTLARDERRVIRHELAPGHGSLRLLSNPRSAQVRVAALDRPADLVFTGTTPQLLESLPAGRYRVEASLPRRHPWNREIEVLPDARAEVIAELNPMPMGRLTLEVLPRDAKIRFLGGAIYEPGVELPVGEYRLAIDRPGFESRTITVSLRSGENLIKERLERLFGRINLRIKPPGTVVGIRYEDAAGITTIDYFPGIRLPAGLVELTASRLGHRSYRKRVELGERGLDLEVRLEPLQVIAGEPLQDSLAGGGKAPALVSVAAGSFRMGSDSGPPDQRPARQVTIHQPFAIGVFEVTRADYARFVHARGREMPSARAEEDDRHPVVRVSWEDAVAYARWLSVETDQVYRLPTEAEWEFATRAGSQGDYSFGDDPERLCEYGNVADLSIRARFQMLERVACDDGYLYTAPVGRYQANPYGLYDVHGNVSEWVQDCWQLGYGSGYGSGPGPGNGQCASRVTRGGSFHSPPAGAASAFRGAASLASDDRGFRVVREF